MRQIVRWVLLLIIPRYRLKLFWLDWIEGSSMREGSHQQAIYIGKVVRQAGRKGRKLLEQRGYVYHKTRDDWTLKEEEQ